MAREISRNLSSLNTLQNLLKGEAGVMKENYEKVTRHTENSLFLQSIPYQIYIYIFSEIVIQPSTAVL